MNKRKIVLGAVALGLLLTGASTASAEWVLLRSGERLEGFVVDIGGVGVTLRRPDGSEMRIPLGNVAVIDHNYDMSAEQESALLARMEPWLGRGGYNGYVCTNGTYYVAREDLDIGGRENDRTYYSSERNVVDRGTAGSGCSRYARVYLAAMRFTPAARTQTARGERPAPREAPPGSIAIPARAGWVDTGLTIARGDAVSFQTTGEVQLSGDENDVAVPAGSRQGRVAPNAPLRGVLAGALIGRVGNSAPFGIGDQSGPLPMPAVGRLFLAVNDDEWSDNRGQFNVIIRVQSRGR
jgi:hypothetical protein